MSTTSSQPLALTRTELIRSSNFIAGQWTPLTAPRLDVTNPATGAVITSVPDSGAAEARAALDAAHAAFPTWRKVPAKQRAAIIKRWNDLVLAHQDVYLPRGWHLHLAARLAAVAARDPAWALVGAFGVGLERITMFRFQIDDMRLLYENDVRFLSQF